MEKPFENWEERAKNLPTLRFQIVDENETTVRMELEDKTVPFIGTPTSTPHGDVTIIYNDYARYLDFNELGIGGTGVVKSCVDPHLNRAVALKVLRPEHGKNQDQRTRFVREARVMAQLEHPNILPIHELGVRPDGVIYYSMKKVNGKTLQKVLDGLAEGNPELAEAYPLEQLLDVFQHICHAMAFAHSRGVIHRDLKPENVLIGPFGEVLVMDWGLAKLVGGDDTYVSRHSVEELDRKLDVTCGTTTLDGDVAGTPLYMAPEQAEGKVSELDQRTDIYGLGAILYEILTLERAIIGGSLTEILTRVVKGEITPPRKAKSFRPDIPVELDAICMKALETRPADRYQDISSLIADLENYEAGKEVSVYEDALPRKVWKWCKRHPVVSSAVTAAVLALVITLGTVGLMRHVRKTGFLEEGDKELAKATAVQEKLLAEVRTLNEIVSGSRLKAVSEEEARQTAKVQGMEAELMGHLRNAQYLFTKARLGVTSGHIPDRIAAANRLRLEYYIEKKDFVSLARYMEFLKEKIIPSLGPDYPNKDILEKLMHMAEGCGTLSVQTIPDNQFLSLWEYRADDSGVLKPVFIKKLGRAPAEVSHIDKGSYLLVTSPKEQDLDVASALPPFPEEGVTYYPVKIDHAEEESVTVRKAESLPDGMVYVASGKVELGGVHSRNLRQHEKEIPGFFIKRNEVTFKEYLEFWSAPNGGNRQSEHMARVRFSRDTYSYTDAWNASGQLIDGLRLDRPVVGVRRDSAVAYCRWLSKRLGRTVRLPTAEEWEKAARGVDGRATVWGDPKATGLSFTLENEVARKKYGNWAPPGSFYGDVSVYGVNDMAGNVREWTSSKFIDSPYFQIKGGSASLTRRFAYCAYSSDTPVVPSDVGFRYVMELDDSAGEGPQ